MPAVKQVKVLMSLPFIESWFHTSARMIQCTKGLPMTARLVRFQCVRTGSDGTFEATFEDDSFAPVESGMSVPHITPEYTAFEKLPDTPAAPQGDTPAAEETVP